MKMQNCDQIKELLSAFLDRETTDEENQIIEAHLLSCESCADEYHSLMEWEKMMDEIKGEEIMAPDGFVESVMDVIAFEPNTVKQDSKKSFWETVLDGFTKKPWIPVAIAAMFMVAVYVPGLFGQMGSSDAAKAKESEFTRSMAPEMANDQNMNLMTTSKRLEPELTMAADEFTDQNTGSGSEDVSVNADRKIIRNGALSMEVTDYRNTEQLIAAQVEEAGGFVSNSQSYVYGDTQKLLAGHMSLRVPEEQFDTLLAMIEANGKVTNKNIYTNDVTEMYFDMETRIRNLEIKEERLLAILEQQGGLQDLLAVENEIAQTRSEIESLTGRLQLLKNQVAFSTIDVDIQEVRDLEQSLSGDGFSDLGLRMRNAFVKNLNLLLDYTARGFIALAGALPIIVPVALLSYAGFWWYQKKHRDK